MSKSKTIQVRVDPAVKDDADRVLGLVGLSMSEAVNVFLHQMILRQGIPFPVEVPEQGHSSLCAAAAQEPTASFAQASVSALEHARTIVELASIVGSVCARYGVDRLVLFGSRARGDARDGSDFDFRIDRGDVRGMDFFSLQYDLEQALHSEIDLVTTESLPPAFANAIQSEEVVLYDRHRTG